jgi:hypothetical protein
MERTLCLAPLPQLEVVLEVIQLLLMLTDQMVGLAVVGLLVELEGLGIHLLQHLHKATMAGMALLALQIMVAAAEVVLQ